MGFAVERHNFISVQDLCASIVNDMQSNGFKVLNYNGTPNTVGGTVTIDNTITKVLLAATDEVDPIAVEDDDVSHPNYALRQPWRFVVEVDQTKQAIRWYCCTPTNIVFDGSDFDVAVSYFNTNNHVQGLEAKQRYTQIKKSGMLGSQSFTRAQRIISPNWPGGVPKFADADDSDEYKYSWRYEHFGFDIENMDRESIPLSYRLAITDHGIAMCMWTEAFDDAGDRFHWWNIQRMVNKDTGEPIIGNELPGIEGKAPLFCVFSMIGGGGGESSVDAAAYDDVYYFVVRERDVNAPTFPVSASIDTADSNRIINTVQQVSISEANKLVISMMKGLNTQRYAYPHELDMIAYVSADVVSQWANVNVRQYGEAEDRSFRALKANHLKNKGMRILMISKGAGIV